MALPAAGLWNKAIFMISAEGDLSSSAGLTLAEATPELLPPLALARVGGGQCESRPSRGEFERTFHPDQTICFPWRILRCALWVDERPLVFKK
jgi:hypothetical protein